MQTCRTLRARALAIVTIAVMGTATYPVTAHADGSTPPDDPAPTAPAVPLATITAVAPANGAVTGGAVVTVTGTDFTGATAVMLGGVPARSFTVGSATTISVVTPVLKVGTHQVSVTTAAGTATGGSYTVGTVEAEVLRLVNEARAEKRTCGSKTYKAVRAVTADATLAKVAAKHSADMARKDYFSHNSRNGDSPFDRIKDAGYRYSTAGENIAAGFRTPASVVKAWLKSPGHCRNIMKKGYTELGVGYASGGTYGSYWTQDFGRPR